MEFAKVLIAVFAVAFLIEVVGFLSIPQIVWQNMSSGQQFVLGFNLFVGFLLIVFAYWIYVDQKKIAHLASCRKADQRKIRRLEEYIERLELLRIDFKSKISESREKAKLEHMFDQLVAKCQANGFLNPRLVVDGRIAEKMGSRKTIEQAIEELYDEYFKSEPQLSAD